MASVSPAPEEDGAGRRPVSAPSSLWAWWTAGVIGLFNIVSLVDWTIVAVLIPEMRADLGLNDFQIGLVQGMAFALFYGAVGLVIGGLVDRHSRRRIMFVGILLWSAAAAGTGLARNYVELFVGRLFVGFGEGAISPSAQSLLSSIFPRDRLSTPMAIFTGSGVIGTSLSFLMGGVLLAAFTANPLTGPLAGLAPWRQVLVVTGIPGLLIALLAFTLLEPPRKRPAVAGEGPSWRDFFGFLSTHRRMMGGLMLGYGLSAMATSGMMTWAPTYARRVLGMGAAEVGGFMSIAVGFGGVVGGLVLGLLVDRQFQRGRRDIALRLYAAMSLIVPPLAAITFVTGNARLMFGAVMLMLLTVGASFGPALAAIQMISPVAMRGRCAALAVLVSNLGGYALGPMLIGALTDYLYIDPDKVGLSIATVLVVLGPLAAAALWWARPPFLVRLNQVQD